MTVCRYYAQGTCRFGDRCRFEHVDPDSDYNTYNYNQRNAGNYQERYGRQNTGYENYRNDNKYGNQRYESKNYAENQRGYSDRYSDNYRHEPSRYSSSYGNQYEGQPRQSYGNQYSSYGNQYQGKPQQSYEPQSRYDGQNYVRNQQYSSDYRQENAYGQNRYKWLSEDFKKQTHQNYDYSTNEYENESYHTSTPKTKAPFSFKVPESEIKKASSPLFQLDEHDQLHADLVKEDAKSWELGGQWPFTSYAPNPSKHGFPNFYDVSPEELRYIAYKATENNSYESYIQAVQAALTQVQEQRSKLQIPTPQLLSVLRQIWNGEDLYSTSQKIDPTTLIQYNKTLMEESMEPDSVLVISEADFSFKMPTETKTSATSVPSFTFKLPAGTEIKPVTPVSHSDPDIYTPLEKLTEEEKAQFSASTFVLGKIPTKPPPQMLCS